MKEVTLHQQEQAALMDLSERHARRLLAAYRELGAGALAHGNRSRRPRNAVPEAVAAAVVRLATTRYPGANHTHLTELLEEHEGLVLSRPTVRRILTRAGMPSPRRRRPPQHRVRRERMPRAGMLLQVDGSHHAWLEQRGPRFALLLAVDDATGAVVHALFRPAEDARGYFLLMEQVLRRSGIPLALYSDRHAVFRASAQQRAGGEASTQFARALAELGVRLIFARSPQAKGRVERMAGTFQDRLVTELRLASATTIAEAQAVLERFLPRFNARFAVAASQREPAWRPLDPALDLGAILAFRHTRSVARDNTVKYHWRTLQLLPSAQRPSYAGARVDVLERPGRRARGAPPGGDHPLPARPAPLGRAARAPLRAGARPGARSPRSGPRLRGGPARPAGASCRGERDRRQRCLTAGPGQAAAPAHPAPADALEGHPPGTTAGALDARHRPAARHLTQHHQEVRPRRRPTRGARVRHHLPSATTQTDIFAEPLSGRSR